jgi:nitronate monooxygenase
VNDIDAIAQRRDFLAQLGMSLPIIQAPMAGVQTSKLAIAVGAAGGLGSLPTATLSLLDLQKELDAYKLATSASLNVNFFVHKAPIPDVQREAHWRQMLAPYFAQHGISSEAIAAGASRAPFSHAAADIVEPFKPAVLSFHFGLPEKDLLARVKSWGSQVWSSATTLEEALWLEANGVDVIIAQGLEAGGHRGMFLSQDLHTQVGCMELIRQIVQRIKLPVVAAGGIANAQGVSAALQCGATAAQIGTAYLLCPEAATSAIHRQALKSEGAKHTAITNLFTGRPARGINNRLMRDLGPINNEVPEFPLASAAIAPLRVKAESLGSSDFTPLWAGQNVSGCSEVSATAMTRELARLVS